MKDLTELQKSLREQRPVPWEQLPDFALYMDQVLSYMERQVLRFDGDDGLTAAMVNNYTKSGLAPRAAGKKYTAFCASLDKAMNITAGELEAREEKDLADDAIHFALLSYAAGVASSHCVAMLREGKRPEGRAKKETRKERE